MPCGGFGLVLCNGPRFDITLNGFIEKKSEPKQQQSKQTNFLVQNNPMCLDCLHWFGRCGKGKENKFASDPACELFEPRTEPKIEINLGKCLKWQRCANYALNKYLCRHLGENCPDFTERIQPGRC